MTKRFLLREEYFGGLLYDRITEKQEILNRWQIKALTLPRRLTPEEILRSLTKSNVISERYDRTMDRQDPVSESMNRGTPSFQEVNAFLAACSRKGVIGNGILAADATRIRRRLETPMLSAPLGIFHMGLTTECHMACVHCYNSEDRARSQRENVLSTERIFDFFEQSREMGLFFMKLQGGEPVLRKDWKAIALKSIECGMATTLYMAGYFRGRERVLRDVAQVPFSEIRLTFGGLREVHDAQRPAKPVVNGRGQPSYEEIITTLHFLLSQKANVKLNFVLGKNNMHQVEEFVGIMAAASRQYAKPFDINFGPQRPFGEGFSCPGDGGKNMLQAEDFRRVNEAVEALRDSLEVRDAGMNLLVVFDIFAKKKDFEPALRVLARDGCGLGKKSFCVTYNGDVGICSFMNACGVLPSGGNITGQSLEKIWFESPLLDMGRHYEKKQCLGCGYYGGQCQGICPAMALYTTGDMAAGDPGCFKHLL